MHLFLYGGDGAKSSALIRDALAKRNIQPIPVGECDTPPAGSVILFCDGMPTEQLLPLLDQPVKVLGVVSELPEALLSHPAVKVMEEGQATPDVLDPSSHPAK